MKQWQHLVVHAVYVFFACCGRTPPVFAGQVSLLAPQPDGTHIRAVQVDNGGNIYIAGVLTPSGAAPGNLTDVFVAKLSADGSQVYRTVLAGSADDIANALALAPDGSAYVVGSTLSNDFPVTSGALQSTLGVTKGGQAFLAKLSPGGQIESATYFGGSAQTSATALVVSATGEIYLTGTLAGAGFPTTPGSTGPGNGFFLAKADANLSKILFATPAYGGTVLTVDSQGNIYTAGATPVTIGPIGLNAPLQTTPGAFQGTAQVQTCYGSGIVFLPCPYQFVEKVDPTATKLLYATFLTGYFGASPAGIAVDTAGNAIIAGTTNSIDYPVTPHALQTLYLANASTPSGFPSTRPTVFPPRSTGFVTKLNPTGTGLIWSTFFGGSVQDAISGMVVDAGGYIYITGQANSNDLPGLFASDPSGCRPSANQGLGFVARLSPDGTSLSPAQLIYGAPVCTYASCFPDTESSSSSASALAVEPNGSAVTAGANGTIAHVDLFGFQRVSCVTDPADNVQLTAVAPGQLLSIFGPRIASVGVNVTFNSIAAPILYASGEQINVQVPYEIAGQSSVELQAVGLGEGVLERRTLSVAKRQPSVFLSPDVLLPGSPEFFSCPSGYTTSAHALALNADGTLNTCSNGALPGSTVTIFMNGLGQTQPPQATGTMPSGPPIPIAPGVTGTGIVSTTTSPGAISAVAQVHVQPATSGFFEFKPMIDGVPARESVVIWVRAQ